MNRSHLIFIKTKLIIVMCLILTTTNIEGQLITIDFIGETMDTGVINGVDVSGQALTNVTFEITDNLTFNAGKINTGSGSGDLIAVSFTLGGTVFSWDPGTFDSGLEVITDGLGRIRIGDGGLNNTIFTGNSLQGTPPINGETIPEFLVEMVNAPIPFTFSLVTRTGVTLNDGLSIGVELNSSGTGTATFGGVPAVPEPSTYIAILFGLALLGFRVRRK
ncbi:PEP-CTERM sorting domain-containing protein [Candidatus Uabimicrobium amorphum]|uniref:Ice-binding protein C-terminal domain-containing protein n=1 Tax=Uabimicrobium amorphum TaxID=2596890 RepID=A0A5S9IN53_UABAM|nr:PEP-CTERM sorting domain-containing protein [Candidatus Uabimicrobium amorphum]BBM84496.1 hypothetical protein UABAM_02857 [Candidatus Uabimicrobium amorphum]